MIKHIEVDGFRSLAAFELSFHPGLNILVGPNGSGKTNIIAYFEFLSQIARTDLADAVSKMGGAGSVFRKINEAGYQGILHSMISGTVEHKGKALEYKYRFRVSFDENEQGLIFSEQTLKMKVFDEGESTLPLIPEKKWDFHIRAMADGSRYKSEIVTWNVNQIPYPMFFGELKNEQVGNQLSKFISGELTLGDSIISALAQIMPSVREVSIEMRGGETFNIIPSRVVSPENSARLPGIERDGSGLAATLYALKHEKKPTRRRLGFIFSRLHRSSASFRRVKLTEIIRYMRLANPAIEDVDVINDSFDNRLRVTCKLHSGSQRVDLPLGSMSDGTIKWLTLITAALTSESIFSIEEPENFLHPRMQSEIVSIMRDAAMKKRRQGYVLLTTHSETLLNSSAPDEIVVVSFEEGKTRASRCSNSKDLAAEISRTGFGLGHYYMGGAIEG